ncbi:MAG: hypothetical protein ACJAVK_000373 [Akkermansiaceae bacterium]
MVGSLFRNAWHFFIPEEHKDLHDKVMNKYRNECIAHHDPTSIELNELIFTMDKQSFRLDPLRYHPKLDELRECYSMVEAVYLNSVKRFGKCLERFPEVAFFEDGYYRFHLDAEKGNEWEPYRKQSMEQT